MKLWVYEPTGELMLGDFLSYDGCFHGEDVFGRYISLSNNNLFSYWCEFNEKIIWSSI